MIAASLAGPVAAQSAAVRIAVGTPGTIALVRSAQVLKRPVGAEHVVVTVSGYQPSPDGPVQIVASAICGGQERAIGRFALLPATAFTPTDTARRQHFGLTLPPKCGRPQQLMVRLVPSLGDGKGAHADIAGATVE